MLQSHIRRKLLIAIGALDRLLLRMGILHMSPQYHLSFEGLFALVARDPPTRLLALFQKIALCQGTCGPTPTAHLVDMLQVQIKGSC